MARVENTRSMSEELLSVETSISSASSVVCAVESEVEATSERISKFSCILTGES